MPAVLAAVGLLAGGLLVERLHVGHRSTGADRRVQVVAAENIWGSIATQLGGVHAEVVSIITKPDTDPHDYEPTAADGRTVAEAQEVIENGVGYDSWAAKLVAADQVDGQQVLDVGHVLGLADGANPHRWYFPADVERVVDRITADYQRLDPTDAAYFAGCASGSRPWACLGTTSSWPDPVGLRGTPVGASESIFVGLAQATGLRSDHARRATCRPSARGPIRPRPTGPRSRPRSAAPDPGVGAQQPERHARHPDPDPPGPSRPHPGDRHHRDAVAGQPLVPGLAGPTSSRRWRAALAQGTGR